LVGPKAGPINDESGSKMGPIGIRQETSPSTQTAKDSLPKHGPNRLSDVSRVACEGSEKWTILDSKTQLNPGKKMRYCRC